MELERFKVWQCVGCGRIDDPRPCLGICRDEKVEFVLASEHDRAMKALLAVVRKIALTAPREGECRRHWDALREEAKRALESLG